MNASVIIPVYNAENFVRKAVESALFHDEVKEILLIEDGSSDNSLEICRDLTTEYGKVIVYQHIGGVNKGASASRNLGIINATQDFICFLDADDFMTEIRFEKEKEIFSEYKAADGVYGAIGTQYYDDIGAKAWETRGLNEQSLTTVNKIILSENLFEFLIGFKNHDNYKGYFSIDAVTIKRDKLIQNNILFNELLKMHEDTVFLWQCAYYLNLYTGEYQKPIAIRGVHKDNRFIFHKNLNDSRSRFYKSLMIWSKRSKIEKKYQEYFISQYMNHKGYSVNKISVNFCKALLYVIYFRNNVKS